jgi:hypothetical protein
MTTVRSVGVMSMLAVFGSTASATLLCMPGTFPTVDQVQTASVSCIANNTEQFNSFSFTSQATGAAALDAGDIGFQILQGAVGPYLIFPQSFSVASPPSGVDVSSSFTFAFSASALNSQLITGFDGHLIGSAMHHGTSLISIDYCAGGPISACPGGQGGVLDVNWITSIDFVTLPTGVNSLNFLITGKIDSPDQGSAASISSFEMAIQPGNGIAIPEPGTAVSLSLGVLLLGIGVRGRLRNT